ncbi:MAG: vitamin K epoxide reductase [Cellulomonadaceae bacterium]|jgi:uncharacterized membrane protein|nr:vitamin K epoxide reductase [Cellulomonadaceae bacterium]
MPSRPRTLAIALTVLGAVGLVASLSLAVDGWRALVAAADGVTDHVLACSIDETLDCAPAMALWQAQILGFPNAYLGVGAFSVMVTSGVAMLAAAPQQLARWFRLALLAGSGLGQVLVLFLMATTFTQLPALCPWCTVIWIVMWPLLWLQVVDAVADAGSLVVPDGLARLVGRERWLLLAIGYVLAAAVGLAVMGPRVL